MRKEYDFSAARKNPYAAQLKKQITIRLDEESITYFKAISEDEDRFVLLGLSSALRLLLVCHCYRVDGNIIRIISARKANTQESRSYP